MEVTDGIAVHLGYSALIGLTKTKDHVLVYVHVVAVGDGKYLGAVTIHPCGHWVMPGMVPCCAERGFTSVRM